MTTSTYSDLCTSEALRAECEARFGTDPMAWAFVCPHCGDVATGQDFRTALEAHPRKRADGTLKTASDVIGQECIGRTLGALLKTGTPYTGRGCDWAAYGLIGGPVGIEVAPGRIIRSFRLADAPVTEEAARA